MDTNSTHDDGKWLQELTPALEALQRAETGPDTRGGETVYFREIARMQFAIDDHGAGSFFRAPDGDGYSELVQLSPRETLALSMFWRSLAYAEICVAMQQKKAERAAAREWYEDYYQQQRAERRAITEIPLLGAPSLEPEMLSQAPRIRTDAEGFRRIELHGFDGWSDAGVVEEVVRLERYGVVLVATDEAAYLMTAQDFDNPAP